MKIKLSKQVGVLVACAAFSLLGACSSSQQDDEALDVSNENSQQGNLGEDDAAEGNGQENYTDNSENSDNEDSNNQYENSNDNQSADVNSDTNDEFELSGNDSSNPTAGMNNTGMNTAAPVNNTAMQPTNAVPMNAAPAPAAPSDSAPVPGGRVRYVREGGVQVVSGPGGAPVFTLEQGDHPVTWEDNGWLRISNGMYVPVDAMSDQGIGRPTGSKTWN